MKPESEIKLGRENGRENWRENGREGWKKHNQDEYNDFHDVQFMRCYCICFFHRFPLKRYYQAFWRKRLIFLYVCAVLYKIVWLREFKLFDGVCIDFFYYHFSARYLCIFILSWSQCNWTVCVYAILWGSTIIAKLNGMS